METSPADAFSDPNARHGSQRSSGPHAAGHGELPHAVPVRVLLVVWLALMVLTVATVAVTFVDLGNLNLAAALGIATVKATLVGLYFMHLRYDNPFHSLLLVAALLFVAIFIGITLLDTGQYQETLVPPPG